MKRGRDNLRQRASRIVALQAKACALGLFTHDRDLPECLDCGLLEDVAFGDNSSSAARNHWVMTRDSGLRSYPATAFVALLAARWFKRTNHAAKKAPELTFQEHVAAFLVREHGYGVLEQTDLTDTEHFIASVVGAARCSSGWWAKAYRTMKPITVDCSLPAPTTFLPADV